MLKRGIFLIGMMLILSGMVSAYSNGYCGGVYNSNQYSHLTKTECLDKNVQCPADKPYVYLFNSPQGCRCIPDPTYKAIAVTETSPPCSENKLELNPTKSIKLVNSAPSINFQGSLCLGISHHSPDGEISELYTKFDLSSIDKSKIISVKYILPFCGGNVNQGLTANLYEYSGLSGSTTWGNKLSLGNKIDSYQITPSIRDIEFDVTNYVKNSGLVVDFALIPSNYKSDYELWESRKGGYLEIETTQGQDCVHGRVVECDDYQPTQEVQVNYYRLQDNNCLRIPLLKSEVTSNDYPTLDECESNRVVEVVPVAPQPSAISSFINKIVTWIVTVFKNLFPQSIAGATLVEPNTQETYQIDLSTDAPDTDWSDGTYQVQYGSWALVDKDGNIKQQGEWEEISDGKYTKSVTLMTPSDIGNFALVGLIDQFDMSYDYTTKTWNSAETIVNKEAIDLQTKYTVVAPSNPNPSPISSFVAFIKSFLCNKWKISYFC